MAVAMRVGIKTARRCQLMRDTLSMSELTMAEPRHQAGGNQRRPLGRAG